MLLYSYLLTVTYLNIILFMYLLFFLITAIQDIKKDLSDSIKLLKFTRRPLNTSNDTVKVAESVNDFTNLLESTSPMPWCPSEGEGFLGRLLYIYTSGTTGLPKAAVISPSR